MLFTLCDNTPSFPGLRSVSGLTLPTWLKEFYFGLFFLWLFFSPLFRSMLNMQNLARLCSLLSSLFAEGFVWLQHSLNVTCFRIDSNRKRLHRFCKPPNTRGLTMENDALAGGRAEQAAGKLSRLLSRAPLLSLMSFLSNESDSLVPGTCHSYTHVTVGFGDTQAFSWTPLSPKHHTPEGNIQRPHTGDFFLYTDSFIQQF